MKDLFRRKEMKYVLDRRQKDALLAALEGYLVPDAFHDYPVHSVYLDTPNQALFTNCWKKPAYREKLRLRFYDNGASYLEVKKKWKGQTYKVRTALDHDQAAALLLGQPAQVEGEAGRICAEAAYAPLFEVRYHRLAWCWQDDPGLRITLDDALTWNEPGGLARSLVPSDTCVLEIKAGAPFPLVLTRALASLEIWPCPISKAGRAFSQLCAGHGTAVLCATSPLKGEIPACSLPIS